MAAVIAAPVSSLRVGFAARVAVRLDQDRVVQVLEAGGQGAGHRQVAEHVAAPEQVERGSAGPALAVAQRDGCQPRWRRPSGHQRRRDCGVFEWSRNNPRGLPRWRRPAGPLIRSAEMAWVI